MFTSDAWTALGYSLLQSDKRALGKSQNGKCNRVVCWQELLSKLAS